MPERADQAMRCIERLGPAYVKVRVRLGCVCGGSGGMRWTVDVMWHAVQRSAVQQSRRP